MHSIVYVYSYNSLTPNLRFLAKKNKNEAQMKYRIKDQIKQRNPKWRVNPALDYFRSWVKLFKNITNVLFLYLFCSDGCEV